MARLVCVCVCVISGYGTVSVCVCVLSVVVAWLGFECVCDMLLWHG